MLLLLLLCLFMIVLLSVVYYVLCYVVFCLLFACCLVFVVRCSSFVVCCLFVGFPDRAMKTCYVSGCLGFRMLEFAHVGTSEFGIGELRMLDLGS